MKFYKSYYFKSASYNFLQRIFALVFGFGSFFLLVRLLSKDEFGVWALFLTITSLAEMIRGGLIQNALIKYLVDADAEAYPKIITVSFVLNILLTLISIIFIYLGAEFLSLAWESEALEWMLYYYILTTVVLVPLSQLNFIEQGNFKFKGIFYSTSVRQGVFFMLILLIYFSEFYISLVMLALFQVVAALAGTLVAYYFTKGSLRFSRKIEFGWVKKLLNFGKYSFGTNVSTYFLKSIDQIMLGSLVSTTSVATYNVALRTTNLIEVPTASIAALIFPQGAQQIKAGGKEAIKMLYEKSVGAILALILPFMTLIMLFPNFITLIIAGGEYLDVVPILQVTILYSLFVPFARQFGTILDSIGRPRITFFTVLATACINALANYYFITNFGTIGAAYGTLTASIFGFIIGQTILSRVLKVGFLMPFFYAGQYYKEGFRMIKRKVRE